MSARLAAVDNGTGISVIISAVIHLAVFLLFAWLSGMSPSAEPLKETYYVDVVSLPAINPQPIAPLPASLPSAPPKAVKTPALPKAAVAVKTVKDTIAKTGGTIKPDTPPTADTEAAFREKMAKLSQQSDAKHAEDTMEKLRNKAKSNAGKNAVTTLSAAEATSRYADFIKSRLEDALKSTSSYSTKKPEVAVRLTISPEGRLTKMKVERSSGDATFELAVRRAVDLASEYFTPTPDKSTFENGFVFRPKGISSNSR